MGTITGNNAIFSIKGTAIGAASNVQISEDFGLQDVDGLGDSEVLELVIGKITHTITGDRYVMDGNLLETLNLPYTGSEWVAKEAFDVTITTGDATVESYTGCKFASHSRSYQKHAIVGENFTIRAAKKLSS